MKEFTYIFLYFIILFAFSMIVAKCDLWSGENVTCGPKRM